MSSNLQVQFAGAAVVTAGACAAAWPSAAGSSLLAQACLTVFLSYGLLWTYKLAMSLPDCGTSMYSVSAHLVIQTACMQCLGLFFGAFK